MTMTKTEMGLDPLYNFSRRSFFSIPILLCRDDSKGQKFCFSSLPTKPS